MYEISVTRLCLIVPSCVCRQGCVLGARVRCAVWGPCFLPGFEIRVRVFGSVFYLVMCEAEQPGAEGCCLLGTGRCAVRTASVPLVSAGTAGCPGFHHR